MIATRGSRWSRPRTLGWILLACLCAPGLADAHTRSVSYSSWELGPGGARVVLRLSQLELTRLPWGPAFDSLDPELARYLTERLQLQVRGQACAVRAGPLLLASPPEQAAIEWELDCPISAAPEERAIHSRLLVEVAPSHLHFARVRNAGGKPLERLMTEAEPLWSLTPGQAQAGASARASPRGSSFAAYLKLGFEHIATGYDHLAFVFALILIAARIGEVATVVTGFTVAHSLTLALAVLGLVEPEMRAIEALIGLSIALVAAENSWLGAGRPTPILWLLCALLALPAALSALGIGGVSPLVLVGIGLFSACYLGLLANVERPARLRMAVAFAFGLVHGFGFAGVLAEVELPADRLAAALFGFNVGVELGQLAVVALLWPLLRALARASAGRWHRLLVDGASAAVCGLGLFWFTTRAFG